MNPKYPLQLEPDQRLVYPVKYLCGTLDPFPTVFHWTDINIINPSLRFRLLSLDRLIGCIQFPAVRFQLRLALFQPGPLRFDVLCASIELLPRFGELRISLVKDR